MIGKEGQTGRSPSASYTLLPRSAVDPRGAHRWIVLGIGVIVASGVVIAFANAITGVPNDGFNDPVAFGILAVLCSVLAMGVYGFFALGPGAESCELDSDGFTLRYRGGRSRVFSWTDRGLNLELTEVSGLKGTEYFLSTRIPFLNPIPADLCAAIVSEGKRRGLVVQTLGTSLPRGGRLTSRISAKVKTPGPPTQG